MAVTSIAFCSEGKFSLFLVHGEDSVIALAAVADADAFNVDASNALEIEADPLVPPTRAGVDGGAGTLFGVATLGAMSETDWASGRNVEGALTTRAELEANGEKFCDGSSWRDALAPCDAAFGALLLSALMSEAVRSDGCGGCDALALPLPNAKAGLELLSARKLAHEREIVMSLGRSVAAAEADSIGANVGPTPTSARSDQSSSDQFANVQILQRTPEPAGHYLFRPDPSVLHAHCELRLQPYDLAISLAIFYRMRSASWLQKIERADSIVARQHAGETRRRK